jgi:ABC-type antimicrobial peptide transport system permease subunit
MRALFSVPIWLLASTLAFGLTPTVDPTQIGVGARALGMGRAFIAVAEDSDVIFSNPALPPEKDIPLAHRDDLLKTLKLRLGSNAAFAGMAWRKATVRCAGKTVPVMVMATDREWLWIRGWTPQHGRFWSFDEEKTGARVCVLTPLLAQQLLGSGDPIGKVVTINGKGFEVIGLRAQEGEPLGPSKGFDRYILVPFSAGRRTLGVEGLSVVRFKSMNVAETEALKDAISICLRESVAKNGGNPESIRVFSGQDMAAGIRRTKRPLLLGCLLVSALALAMSLSFLAIFLSSSLEERRNEFSLKRALGATRRALTGEMVAESLLAASVAFVLAVFVSCGSLRYLNSYSKGSVGQLALPQLSLSAGTLLACAAIVLAGSLIASWPASRRIGRHRWLPQDASRLE